MLKGYSGHISLVIFSPDGKIVASAASHIYRVRLWNAMTGEDRQTLEGHSRVVNAIAFSPDSKTIASASNDKTVRLWNATTGAPQQILEIGTAVYTLSFDTTGSYLDIDLGRILINKPSISDPALIQILSQEPRYIGYDISSDKVWITWNSENLLWVPPGSRPVCSDVAQGASTVAFGCLTGQVLIFGFSTNLPF